MFCLFQFDYFKAVGPATSPYIYAQPGALNGAINSALNGGLGNSSQSPSPGYGQSTMPGPTGGEIYYNGATHPAQLPLSPHQPMYPMETSPAHSEVSTCLQNFLSAPKKKRLIP